MLWPPVQRHPHHHLVNAQLLLIARNVHLLQSLCLKKPENWSFVL